eukprot:SAG11_NODE_25_length_23789_cov_23.813592_4_plen_310_part_00
MIDSNDDFGGSLGSQLIWTAPSSGQYVIQVRGYRETQRGRFELGVSSSGGGGGGSNCNGCLYNNACRDREHFPQANEQTCLGHGGVWGYGSDAQGGNRDGDPCDGGVELDSLTGSVTFTEAVDNNQECSWTINCPIGMPTFTLTLMDTEANFDFVNIMDGSGDALVDPLSGDELPNPVTSDSSTMTIQYTSDGSVTSEGFSGDFACGTPGRGGGGGRGGPPPPSAPEDITPPAHVAGEIVNGGDRVEYELSAVAGTTYTIESSASGDTPLDDTCAVAFMQLPLILMRYPSYSHALRVGRLTAAAAAGQI